MSNKHLFNPSKIVSGITILFTILISSFILIYNECVIEENPLETMVFMHTMDMGMDEFGIKILNPMEPGDYNDDVIINYWTAEGNDDQLYFFLPANWQYKDIFWLFNLEESVFIDGNEVGNGSRVSISDGSHVLKFSSGEQYTVELLYSSNIDSIFIEMDAEDLEEIQDDKENTASAKYQIYDVNGECTNSGEIENIRCRGEASFYETQKKRSYALELAEETDILGFGANKKWLLISNIFDKSLLRNSLAYEIAEKSKMPYIPQMDHVDVYINGEYNGNYLLSEKLEVDPNRVDIYDLEEENRYLNANEKYKYNNRVSNEIDEFIELKWNEMDMEPKNNEGGYLLELDIDKRYVLESSGFITSRNRPVVIQSPKWASYNQVKYIADIYQDFEDAVYSDDGMNPNSKLYYTEYIDIDSFVKHYLIDEISQQIDAAVTSFYLYKPADNTKIFAGPIWDYDKSFGTEYLRDGNPEGLYASEDKTNADLWNTMYQMEDFRDRAKAMYKSEIRSATLDVSGEWLTKKADRICRSAVMDSIRWETYENVMDSEKINQLYNDEVDWIQEFVRRRIDFLDKEWE